MCERCKKLIKKYNGVSVSFINYFLVPMISKVKYALLTVYSCNFDYIINVLINFIGAFIAFVSPGIFVLGLILFSRVFFASLLMSLLMSLI